MTLLLGVALLAIGVDARDVSVHSVDHVCSSQKLSTASGISQTQCQSTCFGESQCLFFAFNPSGVTSCITYSACDTLSPDAGYTLYATLPTPYVKLPYGSAGCPEGTHIWKQSDCEKAITTLGITGLGPLWSGTRPDIPKYCSVRESEPNPRGYFGGDKSGGIGRSDLAPLCVATCSSFNASSTCPPSHCTWEGGVCQSECTNTRDNKPGKNSCALQISMGNENTNSCKKHYLNSEIVCDSACNLCACSTAVGNKSEHCSGHGQCTADCTQKTCSNAACVCDAGWTGDKCSECTANSSCDSGEECKVGVCLPANHTNLCICSNGEGTSGANCSSNGEHSCASCLPGYHINGNMCNLNQCRCPGGHGATGKDCPVDGEAKCESCEAGYHLNGTSPQQCLLNECTCSHGNGTVGTHCPNHGQENCTTCDIDYFLDGAACHVNECLSGNSTCDSSHGSCQATTGGFVCLCDKGYSCVRACGPDWQHHKCALGVGQLLGSSPGTPPLGVGQLPIAPAPGSDSSTDIGVGVGVGVGVPLLALGLGLGLGLSPTTQQPSLAFQTKTDANLPVLYHDTLRAGGVLIASLLVVAAAVATRRRMRSMGSAESSPWPIESIDSPELLIRDRSEETDVPIE